MNTKRPFPVKMEILCDIYTPRSFGPEEALASIPRAALLGSHFANSLWLTSPEDPKDYSTSCYVARIYKLAGSMFELPEV